MGRSEELSLLLLRAQETFSRSHGNIVFVTGEPGVGKTRLAQELQKTLNDRVTKVITLTAKSERGNRLSPYAPMSELIREFAATASTQLFYKVSGVDVEQIVRIVPELAESAHVQKRDIQPISPETDNRDRLYFFQVITSFFERLSKETPLLLILDDLQWADLASIQLLEFMTNSADLPTSPILLLCLFRDISKEENHPLADFAERLTTGRRNGGLDLFRLDRLDSSQVENLIDSFLSVERGDGDLISYLNRASGGNPFFLQELLRSLIENGELVLSADGGWHLRGRDYKLKTPLPIRSILLQRIDRLTVGSREILSNASLIGDRFSVPILQGLFDSSKEGSETVTLKLNEAQGLGLIYESSQRGIFCFRDESIRDVILDLLPAGSRRSLHQRIASLLESYYSENLREHAEELSFHFLEASNLSKAQEYCMMAADKATRVYAHHEAARHYKNLLDLLDKEKGEEKSLVRAELLERLGDSLELSGDVGSAINRLSQAVNVYTELSEYLKAGNAYRKLGLMSILASDHKKSLEFFLKANELLEASPLNEEYAYLCSHIAFEYAWMRDFEESRYWSNRGLIISEKIGAHKAMSMALINLALLMPPTKKTESLSYVCRALQVSLDNQHFYEAAYSYFGQGYIKARILGASSETETFFEEAMMFAGKVGYPNLAFWNHAELAYEIYFPLGRWSESLSILERYYAQFESLPDDALPKLIATSSLAQVLESQGELERSEKLLKSVFQYTSKFAVLNLDIPMFTSLGSLNFKRGNYEEAERYLIEGYEISKREGQIVPYIRYLMSHLTLLIELQIKTVKSSALIEEYLSELRKMAESIATDWGTAYYQRAEGMVALMKGDYYRASVAFDESESIFKKLAWPYELAKTEVKMGELLMEAGKEPGICREQFDKSLQVFRRLGAKWDIENVESLMTKIELNWEPKFHSHIARLAFENLMGAFASDFLSKKIEGTKCGWKSLSQLSRDLNVSHHRFYGKNGAQGAVLNELLKTGFVESRSFPNERGRGGEITKIRIAIETSPAIRDYFNRTHKNPAANGKNS